MNMIKNTKVSFMILLALSMTFIFPAMIAENVNANQIIERRQASADLCGPVNVRESLVLSIVSMCLGGVLEKANEWKQIKCRAVVCQYEAVKNNLDPTFCKDQEAFLTCSYIVGEAFAIPPMSILEYYREAIARVLANPVGVLWGAGARVARNSIQACSTAGNCDSRIFGAQAIFLAVTDIAGVAQTISQLLENGFNLGGNQQDYCEQLPDIKKEMQEILGEDIE